MDVNRLKIIKENKEGIKMELVKIAYNVFVGLSDLRLLLLWDEELCKENYTSLEFIINNCKDKIDDIINMIEKYCKDEKE